MISLFSTAKFESNMMQYPPPAVTLTLHIFLSHQNKVWLGPVSTSTVELQESGVP